MVRALQVLGCGVRGAGFEPADYSAELNEDLVELFETTGQVELVEILFDGARSKGCGLTSPATVGLSKFGPSLDYFPHQIKSLLTLGMFDNLIFHPTENHVIVILDWELCTLGSPLADLANLTMDWSIAPTDIQINPNTPFMSESFKGVPERQLFKCEYCRLTNQPYPITEMVFAWSWMLFRLAVISQGTAAHVTRQQAIGRASSAVCRWGRVSGSW
ncbi:hypothetical protein K438DRAFT_1992804 [Mycena galopus ATCC 62051]|nr:hypothetical protein K438DRAFT_1992804 [Mycena galopus ATCC 62051]